MYCEVHEHRKQASNAEISKKTKPLIREIGWVAEWSCSGLQSRVRRFDSGPSLQIKQYASPGGEIGRRKGLKIPRW